MAQKKPIQFKGIQRALPQSDMPDGACQEIINTRFRKGCWRPIGDKMEHKSFSVSDYTAIWLHDIENGVLNGEPNYIGYKKDIGMLFSIHPTTGAAAEITRDETPGIDVTVVFLKRTMIVSSESGVEVFLFTSNKTYVKTATLVVPDVDLRVGASKLMESDHFHSAEAVLGGYYKSLNTASESEGYMFGSIMYITAYRLFDGSYIMPCIPKYLEISNGGLVEQNNPSGGSQSDSTWWFEFYASKLQATINNELYTEYDLGSTKDLIESVCVFATKATPLHNISSTTLTDAVLATYGTGENHRHFDVLFPVDDKFKKLAQSIGWYKIHEFVFDDVVGKIGKQTKDVDTVGYYQDYATRETLTTDQFTHHILSAREAYVYNDRLHLANIKTSLGSPYVIWPDDSDSWGSNRTIAGKVTVWLKTSLGSVIVTRDISIPVYLKSTVGHNTFATENLAFIYRLSLNTNALTASPPVLNYIPYSAYIKKNETTGLYEVWFKQSTGATEYFLIPSVVGYNDSRSYKMQVTVTISGSSYFLFSKDLTKNEGMNFSSWNGSMFFADQSNVNGNFKFTDQLVSTITFPTIAPDEIGLPFDPNRVQVSEIQNPLIFPTKNSYQIGTGSILKLMAGSEPLSSGQFGQFPLQVFTTKGIWAMEIGLGDVLYTNILPVNGEVADNPKNIIPVGSGVVYSTARGLFIVNGRHVVEISEGIENNFEELVLIDAPEVTELLTNIKYVPNLLNSLSRVGFLSYLSSSSIGYDHLNKELIVTNENYSYSYIYSFDSQTWYKISQSFKLLINSYPKLLGVTASNILSLSDESDANKVECFIMSAAQSLESPDAFKKIEQTVLRSKLSIQEGSNAVFCVFASDDLKTWQLLIGRMKSGSNQVDMTVQRTHVTSKYYAFVFAGKISTDSELKQLEIIFNVKWNNHLH